MTSLEQHLAAHGYTFGVCGCGQEFEYDSRTLLSAIRDAHRAHVAATWREARTVRTVEELDALPKGTLVSSRGIIYRNRGWASLWQMIMHTKSGNAATPLDLDPDDIIPALIVWTPEDGAL